MDPLPCLHLKQKEIFMTIDIADFFTDKNEKEGVWYEPVINGKGIGIEFKILGNSCDAAIRASEEYDKALAAAEKELDVVKRARLKGEAMNKRIEVMVTDIRGKDGREILINGQPLTYTKENVMRILDESKAIKSEILDAFMTSETFMTRKD